MNERDEKTNDIIVDKIYAVSESENLKLSGMKISTMKKSKILYFIADTKLPERIPYFQTKKLQIVKYEHTQNKWSDYYRAI